MSASLALRLLLTPFLVGAATLAGRRWGGRLAGWLVGFPLTSAPVVLILALDHGTAFASAAAVGILLGTGSQALFAIAYASAARRRLPWAACLGAATVAFTLATLAFRLLVLPLVWCAAFVYLLAAAAIALVRPPSAQPPGAAAPAFDLPARMVVATLFVLVLTAVAPLLGARLSGLLSPYPVYGGVLAVFAQRSQGPSGGVAVMSGLALGLVGFASFFVVLATLLPHAGLAVGFAAATASVLAVQGGALLVAARR